MAEGVLEALDERDDVRGTRVLYVAAEDARDVLSDGLTELGCRVDVVSCTASRGTARAPVRCATRLLRAASMLVTFTSASAVRGFIEAVGADARAARARDRRSGR